MLIRSLIFALMCIAAAASAVSGQQTASQTTPPPDAAAVRIGYVVDNSGSMRLSLERVIRFITELSRHQTASDEAFLVTFVNSSKIVLQQEATKESDEIRDAAENMFIEGGQTALLDAVKFAAEYASRRAAAEPMPTVLVVITDGDDRESTAKPDEVVKLLHGSSIKVFAVGISDGKVAGKILDRLTKETGGKRFTPRTSAETEKAVAELASAVRLQ